MNLKKRAIIIDRCGDDEGDLLRIGRKGSRYFIEKIGETYTAQAGQTTRTYLTKKAAQKRFSKGCDYLGV